MICVHCRKREAVFNVPQDLCEPCWNSWFNFGWDDIMDGNKFQKLIDVGYRIQDVCAFCKHSDLTEKDCWGTCKKHQYKHRKHSGDDRDMSINAFGKCMYFEADESKMSKLGRYAEFR
jgi:hypothetical protein